MIADLKFIHQIHEYERSRTNKSIYRCIHPRCTHYKDRHLLEGKLASCHKCHNPFILSWKQLRNRWPVCDYCSKSPKAIELNQLKEITEISKMPDDETIEELIERTLE